MTGDEWREDQCLSTAGTGELMESEWTVDGYEQLLAETHGASGVSSLTELNNRQIYYAFNFKWFNI